MMMEMAVREHLDIGKPGGWSRGWVNACQNT